jgi:hypothetical protein
LKQWLLSDGTGGWRITCPTTIGETRNLQPGNGQHANLAVTRSTARRKPKKKDTEAAAAKVDTCPPMMTHRRDDPGHTERFADDGQRTWRVLPKTSGMEQTAEALTKYTEGNQLMATHTAAYIKVSEETWASLTQPSTIKITGFQLVKPRLSDSCHFLGFKESMQKITGECTEQVKLNSK